MSQPHLQAETISRGLWMSKIALFGFILHRDLSRDFSKTFILGTMCKWTHPSRCSGKRKLHIHNQHIASTSWRCISRKLQWFAQGCSPCGAIILEASSVSAIASPVFETAEFVNTPSTDMIKHYSGHYLVQSWPFFDYRRKMALRNFPCSLFHKYSLFRVAGDGVAILVSSHIFEPKERDLKKKKGM
jgi:hypothetical protein